MCIRLEERVLHLHLPPRPQYFVKFLSRLRKAGSWNLVMVGKGKTCLISRQVVAEVENQATITVRALVQS